VSYLHRPGLAFSGDFEANVATGNNDPAFYTDPPTTPAPDNANWNVLGGGEFRFLNCAVGAVLDDEEIAADDPVRTAVVTDAVDRVAAKIVDLDPQYQSASELYGLRVRVVANGVELLAGEFAPSAFRDYGSMHARYVSVLGDLTWAPPGTSRFVDRLRDAAEDGLVAIRLTTHSYNFDRRIGRIEGAIGPHRHGEPRRFVAGRHFRARRASPPLNGFDGVVDGDRLTVDLSNSLAVDGLQPTFTDEIRLGLLTAPNTAMGAVVADGQDVITLSGPVPYRQADWLRSTGGLVTVDLPAAASALVERRPLALVSGSAERRVALRETPDGLLVRADDETLRLDPGQPVTTRILVTRYGVPQSGVQVDAEVDDPAVPPTGGPPINTPKEWLVLHPMPKTDGGGWTELRIEGDQEGAALPRPLLDGQLYEVVFGFGSASDLVVVHLYEEYEPPDEPTWNGHVRKLLEPYAEQYPLMKERVFDIGDYATVKSRREILWFALSRERTDPNHMPVTRDLSAQKCATILAWLAQPDPREGDVAPPTPAAVTPAAAPAVLPDDVPAAFVGKLRAARRRAEVLGREEPTS
jgi:hypothetical protein